jgi:acyl-CoA thioesterase
VNLAIGLSPVAAGEWSAQVPDTWHQGRGAWGGIVLAIMVRGAELAAADVAAPGKKPVVRSVSGSMSGPLLVGTATVKTRIIRAGSNVITVGVDLLNEGDTEVAASAVVVLGSARASALDISGGAWQIAPPHDVADALAAGIPDGPDFDFMAQGPEFFGHLGAKPVQGFPGLKDPHATTIGWIRLKGFSDVADAAWLAALSDAWWTATIVGTDGTRPMATISFQVDLLIDATSLDTTSHLLHVGRNQGAHEGYVAETRELWTSSGQLAARCNQMVAVIR